MAFRCLLPDPAFGSGPRCACLLFGDFELPSLLGLLLDSGWSGSSGYLANFSAGFLGCSYAEPMACPVSFGGLYQAWIQALRSRIAANFLAIF